MSDIVERLTDLLTAALPPYQREITEDALAEIERLQKEWLSLYGVERMRFEAVQRMTAEIEQLKAALTADPPRDAGNIFILGWRAAQATARRALQGK
jgi:uncharacterized small protein (DUF1192 family)